MTISFDIPEDIERTIRRSGRDAATELKEAALVELYRLGKISHGEFANALGISRSEADTVLKRHHVTEDLVTGQELRERTEQLRKMAG